MPLKRKIIMNKKTLLPVLFLVTFNVFSQDPAPCSRLFFSEIIEGSSNNKGLELFNPTSGNINLSDYTINIYFNGLTTLGSTFVPIGILPPGQTFTIVNTSSGATLSALGDTT